MKHPFTFQNKITSLIIAAFIVLSAFQSGDMPCDQKTLKDNVMNELLPYQYDMAKLTRVMYKEAPQLKEVEIPLFIGEKYRLVFNTEALPKPVTISLYNREKDSKKRKLLFTTKDAEAGKKYFSFDYSFANKIYIDYEIPAGDSATKSGCVLFMMGYK